jgi:hypothetical protein
MSGGSRKRQGRDIDKDANVHLHLLIEFINHIQFKRVFPAEIFLIVTLRTQFHFLSRRARSLKNITLLVAEQRTGAPCP